MREAHTIKGSAMMMGYKRISDIAYRIEDGLQAASDQKIIMEKTHYNLLFKCLDSIELLLKDEDKVALTAKGIDEPYFEKIYKEVDLAFSGKKPDKPAKEEKRTEISGDKLAEPAKEGKRTELTGGKSGPSPSAFTTDKGSLRVDIGRLDKLMNLSGELVISKIRLNELVKNLMGKVEDQEALSVDMRSLIAGLKTVYDNMDFSISNMKTEVMRLRMVPVSYLFNTFPRAMRDMAISAGKDIELEIKGDDTQLDKGIIDDMKEPIMHLLRNAVDHGIEEPALRESKNKHRPGKIFLNAYQKGSQVIIEVTDDGRGMDINKIKEQALSKGLVAKEKIDKIGDEQILQLVFTPGFSTKEDVTDISGRGVGLDVVREKIGKLKSIIDVVSKADEGVSFIIKLPLTLAITESLLVAAGNEIFAVPIDTIVETIKINPSEINTIETKEAITVRGRIIPLVRLNEVVGLPQKGIFEKRFYSVVVVQSVEKKIGLLVDQLCGRQEVVSKPLGEPLKNIKYIAGGTILGDGRVILILDIPSIIESAERVEHRQAHEPIIQPAIKKKEKTVLLAEDILSTAMFEKNILTSAGFSVVIARDGEEALKKAGREKFDLVITDILMPKMDGIELTKKLKKDEIYKDIPVIMVTTRESDRD